MRDRLAAIAGQTAIIIGDDEALERVAEAMEIFDTPPDDILASAAVIAFPTDYFAEQDREAAQMTAQFGPIEEPEVGDWPDKPQLNSGTALAMDYQGHIRPRVHIAVLPTADATEAPAYLKFGGWNACPDPALHVAALRSWRTRYGAEIITCSSDILEVRVTFRPSTRDEAIALATEQYRYCADIVEQGVGTISELAALLMESDHWYFWWD